MVWIRLAAKNRKTIPGANFQAFRKAISGNKLKTVTLFRFQINDTSITATIAQANPISAAFASTHTGSVVATEYHTVSQTN